MDAIDAADELYGVDGHDGVMIVEGPSAIEPVMAVVTSHDGRRISACGDNRARSHRTTLRQTSRVAFGRGSGAG